MRLGFSNLGTGPARWGMAGPSMLTPASCGGALVLAYRSPAPRHAPRHSDC